MTFKEGRSKAYQILKGRFFGKNVLIGSGGGGRQLTTESEHGSVICLAGWSVNASEVRRERMSNT